MRSREDPTFVYDGHTAIENTIMIPEHHLPRVRISWPHFVHQRFRLVVGYFRPSVGYFRPMMGYFRPLVRYFRTFQTLKGKRFPHFRIPFRTVVVLSELIAVCIWLSTCTYILSVKKPCTTIRIVFLLFFFCCCFFVVFLNKLMVFEKKWLAYEYASHLKQILFIRYKIVQSVVVEFIKC